MIYVSNLCKDFYERRVLFDISFEVGQGEIVGFLGPNGAGKTTVMKVITGFMTPTSGQIKVLGRTPGAENFEMRSEIGYLPEVPPLYLDMRVHEYLDYVARLKGVVAGGRKSAVDAASAECGLQGMEGSMIRTLSKGYRQRVGLAQAIVHSPRLLILDEPGGGLDPKQRAALREILGGMAGRFTVLFSSHDLHMAAGVCSRYVIIDKGRIAGEGTRGQLAQRAGGSGRYVFVFRKPPCAGESRSSEVPGTEWQDPGAGTDLTRFASDFIHRELDFSAGVLLSYPGGSAVDIGAAATLEVETTIDVRPGVVEWLVRSGAEVLEVRREDPDMENLFMHFTTGETK